jgi:hypothetical protein
MAGDYFKWLERRELEHTWVDAEPLANLQWAAVDLDGTLAQGIWTPDNPTSKIGLPIWENVDKVLKLDAEGYKITIHTARGWTDYNNIERWLNHFQIPHRRIVCGKILAKVYIDDRALNADAESWIP